MADEMSNVNGGSSTSDSLPVIVQQADVTSRLEGAIEIYRQQVEESHHDLVNLLTQQMTIILNPMMADHESKFERLVRQVERIALIVDYEDGERHNARGNNEGFENIFQNENDVVNRENPYVVLRDRTYEKRRRRSIGVSNDLKSKPFTRKEKVAYVTMESSEEEIDFETEAIGVWWIRNCQEFQKQDAVYGRNAQWEHRGLLEINIPTIVVEPGGIQEAEEEEKISITIRSLKWKDLSERNSVSCKDEKRQSNSSILRGSTRIKKLMSIKRNDDMIGTISIIPIEYLGEYEDEPGYFLRPTEKQMSHLRPLHITTTLSGIKVNKVLIDGGATISLLPERMLIKVRKHPDDLVPTNIVVTNFRCYLSSEGLSVKLGYPELGFAPTEYGVETGNPKVKFKMLDKNWLRGVSFSGGA
ncbi:hypothetical protein Ahy_B09g098769 [Arachis hypogaea]|uniref:Peptidase A2 domain-containing protein n=1 Tax=Arachis hypogaea TaxID=3818 RepID=A0A444XS18_ARAHY|nr:hypothetical protein Ahy_B09g098769 [Arachis hypogaea]